MLNRKEKMQKRTFIRTMLDIVFENAVVKTVASLVNFCKEQLYYNRQELKFLKNLPINKIEVTPVQNKFLFKVNK